VGLIGAALIATLVFIFAWRGLRTSLRARDPFGRYPVVGVTTMIVVQAFFNISVVLEYQRGAGPAADQGHSVAVYLLWGSSLFVMLGNVGVLLNVSQQTE
jgi:cell division protein FtsW